MRTMLKKFSETDMAGARSVRADSLEKEEPDEKKGRSQEPGRTGILRMTKDLSL